LNQNNLQSDETIAQAFDSYCKKILKYIARDFYVKQRRQREHEKTFSCLSAQELAQLTATDEYFKDAYRFSVLDYEIGVTNEQLAKALSALPADRREIVLLSYFLDMNDGEIADKLNLVRRTVAYRRASTLQKLKNIWRERNEQKQKSAAAEQHITHPGNFGRRRVAADIPRM
jgi:RNA polymerase sigma factor (sigma-70 family)